MKCRFIKSIGIVALSVGIFSSGEASGSGFVYSRIDRATSIQSLNQMAAPLWVSSRPKLARIPNLNVYYAPGVRYNLYMIDKIWYLSHNEKWYRGETHEGPWHYLSYSKVPEKLKKFRPNSSRSERSLRLKRKPSQKRNRQKPLRKKFHPNRQRKIDNRFSLVAVRRADVK
ncbi:MAG: hypothetical protein MPW14_12135 [Candidatus Manganitrophus sp.]|nr:hypothetical protein [Candidatus Manganitrophus sp.]WDT82408.1 MAG: hypothetical protein MPW14_12135 [Candidatus Manganitrophus sp.]